MTTNPLHVAILEVVDELPLGACFGRGRPMAPDVAAVLAGLPDHPKWAVVFSSADGADRKKVADRFAKLAKKGIQVHNGAGCVYVRRKAVPTETATPAPPTPDFQVVAVPNDPDAAAKRGPGRPPKSHPAPAPLDPDPARPKIIGWLGMPRARRMDFFVASWNAHQGDRAAVAAELDISTALVDQWRRDAKTEGRIR
jgi:hypothetical protein